jgi:hypothetical protein
LEMQTESIPDTQYPELIFLQAQLVTPDVLRGLMLAS